VGTAQIQERNAEKILMGKSFDLNISLYGSDGGGRIILK
jgi:hypothetical protein